MAQSLAERRAAQRRTREQIRKGTYQRSNIGLKARQINRKSLETNAIENMSRNLAHRDRYNEDNVQKRLTDPNIPAQDLRAIAEMDEDALVNSANQPIPEGYRFNPFFYH
jgi:hypothetical protein